MMDEDHHTLWNALVEACYLLDAQIATSPNEEEIWDFLNRIRTNETTARIQKEVLKSNKLVSNLPEPHYAHSPNVTPYGNSPRDILKRAMKARTTEIDDGSTH